MTIISVIAAIDEQRGLGKNNQLLCHLPADLKHFKTITLNKPIIMGRHTYMAIGRPLPQRQNIVLSRHVTSIEGVDVVSSVAEALEITSDVPEVMIIGGADLFEQTLIMADRVYLTIIHHQFDADVFFPILDDTHWKCVESQDRPKDEKNPFDMTFCCFHKILTVSG